MKKMLRKLSLVFVVMTLCVSVFSCFSVSAAEDASVWTAREKAEGTVRFAVLSDSHLIKDTSRLDLAFQTFSNIGGFDGMMMVGDIVYMEKLDILYPERYTLLNETINKYESIKSIPNAYVMGNHEYPQGTTDTTISENSQAAFIEGISLNTDRNGVKSVSGTNAVYEMGGYTVVAASPEAYSNVMSAETEAWAKAEIEAAVAKNPEKPVFYLQHQPLQNTVRSSSTLVNSNEFLTWIKTQKTVINFTAHCHYSSYDPQSIWQSEDGFTTIHSAVLGGGYLSGIVGSYERTNITDVAYAMMVEIDKDNVVKVYKLDLYNGEMVGTPWVIDVNSDERLYTDARYENINVPAFVNGETLTVDKVTGHSVTVTFPDSAVMEESVPGVSNDGFVLYWKVEAINKATGSVSQYVNRYGDFWTKKGYDTRTVTVNNLDRNTEYEIRVVPFSPLNAKTGIGGTPITAQIKTTNEKDATDASLISTKLLNVAQNKTVTASAPDATYVPSNLTDNNRNTFVVPASDGVANADWFTVDLEKRYKVSAVEVYDRANTADEGGRRALSIEGSNDPDSDKWDVLDTLADGNQDELFPDNGCFKANGNGNAYRYIRVRRTGGYYYGYSEIKVYAEQDVTEVSRKKNAVADLIYSSTYAASKAVNGTISDSADAWLTEDTNQYHYWQVDLEKKQNIGLIEAFGRYMENENPHTRTGWYAYGHNSIAPESELITTAGVTQTAVSEYGYTKYFYTGAPTAYPSAEEYVFPRYDAVEKTGLQQVVSDKNAYRYVTFASGYKFPTAMSEIKLYELNPMVNSVSYENGVIAVDFSDTMDESTLADNIKVYDGSTNLEVISDITLSDDMYTVSITPSASAAFYKVEIADDVLNLYGTDMASDFECYTTPENLYEGFLGRKGIYANVAKGKPITSEGLTVYDGYPVEFANDGTVGAQGQIGDGSGKILLGTAIGVGAGHIQIDLLNRYNLDKIEVVLRPDNDYISYATNLRVTASDDVDFKDYDVLDEIVESNPDKLVPKGVWEIDIDGKEDYRYLRIERPINVGEWGFAEIRAYAEFDGISLTKNATADSYYHYGKGLEYEAAFLPKNVIDGVEGTFHVVFPDNTTKPAGEKMTYLQVDLKDKYHVGYLELVSRVGGYSGAGYYQHFDIFGSNIGDIVTDDEVDTHPYLNTKWLEDVEGYKKLSRVMGNVSLGINEKIWEFAEGKVYQAPLDDREAYQYITHKTNTPDVGTEISEMKIYSIAQRVNAVNKNENNITLDFMGQLMPSSVSEENFKLYSEDGNEIGISSVSYEDCTVSITSSEDISGGKIVVMKDVMNQYAVPMASDYEYTFEKEEKAEAIENAELKVNGSIAEGVYASTQYTFTATYNNLDNSEKAVYTYIVLRDKTSGIIKNVNISDALSDSGILTATLTTGENVDNCMIDVFIWYEDMKPLGRTEYFK